MGIICGNIKHGCTKPFFFFFFFVSILYKCVHRSYKVTFKTLNWAMNSMWHSCSVVVNLIEVRGCWGLCVQSCTLDCFVPKNSLDVRNPLPLALIGGESNILLLHVLWMFDSVYVTTIMCVLCSLYV